jgi:hypothetical protein
MCEQEYSPSPARAKPRLIRCTEAFATQPGKTPVEASKADFGAAMPPPSLGASESQRFRGFQVPLFEELPPVAQARAERPRQDFLNAAANRWKKAVKELGLNGTAYRSGMRAIEISPRPGQAVNGLFAKIAAAGCRRARRPRSQICPTSRF